MTHTLTLPRDLLSEAFGGNYRLVAAFEEQARVVEDLGQTVETSVAATGAINEATVLTLSPNATFANERVVRRGLGIGLVDQDGHLTIRIDTRVVPRIAGDREVTFHVTEPSTLLLPPSGRLATVGGAETLSSKTLARPKISTAGDFADDPAAAAGGVPVGGIYRTGSVVKVRVT